MVGTREDGREAPLRQLCFAGQDSKQTRHREVHMQGGLSPKTNVEKHQRLCQKSNHYQKKKGWKVILMLLMALRTFAHYYHV